MLCELGGTLLICQNGGRTLFRFLFCLHFLILELIPSRVMCEFHPVCNPILKAPAQGEVAGLKLSPSQHQPETTPLPAHAGYPSLPGPDLKITNTHLKLKNFSTVLAPPLLLLYRNISSQTETLPSHILLWNKHTETQGFQERWD